MVVARHFDVPCRIKQAESRPSENSRERASRRGGAPRIPGMNAGPKTACGGKRPLTGVVAQPFAGDLFPLDPRPHLLAVVDVQNRTRR
jgi:hypothetical protein